MISLALPLTLLYEISIWCVRLIENSRARDDAARAAEQAP
jgi:Sec-independent protein secretion pathway component TatC